MDEQGVIGRIKPNLLYDSLNTKHAEWQSQVHTRIGWPGFG